jgi:glutaredoxin
MLGQDCYRKDANKQRWVLLKDLKGLMPGTLELGRRKWFVELKVFTLPSCSSCPLAKAIASEVARKFNIAYKEVNLATVEGLSEGKAHDILSAPSISVDDEVIIRGGLVSRQRLEEEVRKRIEKWSERVSKERT